MLNICLWVSEGGIGKSGLHFRVLFESAVSVGLYLYKNTERYIAVPRLPAHIPAAIFHSPPRNSLAQAKITSVRSGHGVSVPASRLRWTFFVSLSYPIYIYTICMLCFICISLSMCSLPPCVEEKCILFFSFLLAGVIVVAVVLGLFYLSLVFSFSSLRSEAFEDVREFFFSFQVFLCVCVLYNWNVGSCLFLPATDYFYRRTDGHLLYVDSE